MNTMESAIINWLFMSGAIFFFAAKWPKEDGFDPFVRAFTPIAFAPLLLPLHMLVFYLQRKKMRWLARHWFLVALIRFHDETLGYRREKYR